MYWYNEKILVGYIDELSQPSRYLLRPRNAHHSSTPRHTLPIVQTKFGIVKFAGEYGGTSSLPCTHDCVQCVTSGCSYVSWINRVSQWEEWRVWGHLHTRYIGCVTSGCSYVSWINRVSEWEERRVCCKVLQKGITIIASGCGRGWITRVFDTKGCIISVYCYGTLRECVMVLSDINVPLVISPVFMGRPRWGHLALTAYNTPCWWWWWWWWCGDDDDVAMMRWWWWWGDDDDDEGVMMWWRCGDDEVIDWRNEVLVGG